MQALSVAPLGIAQGHPSRPHPWSIVIVYILELELVLLVMQRLSNWTGRAIMPRLFQLFALYFLSLCFLALLFGFGYVQCYGIHMHNMLFQDTKLQEVENPWRTDTRSWEPMKILTCTHAMCIHIFVCNPQHDKKPQTKLLTCRISFLNKHVTSLWSRIYSTSMAIEYTTTMKWTLMTLLRMVCARGEQVRV